MLVSTMIVESGLDVPNANTMFVNRADHFGLAQLYQLRGRVGRSHRRAYCYLMVPDAIDEDSERRLQVLEHHTELGAGYRIALKDLELRGAGNLLGAEQSGFVQAVGFDLYLRLLEDTVRRVQAGESAPRDIPADVTLDVPAYLPDEFVAVTGGEARCLSPTHRPVGRRRGSRSCGASCATDSAPFLHRLRTFLAKPCYERSGVGLG